MDSVKITKKLSTVGSSVGIIVDKSLLDKMNLKKGDFVEVIIKKLE